MTERSRVLVVGGGPVGLALAGDLGWRGIDTLLIERTDGEVVQPKMVLVGVRSLEFCRRWGIAAEVETDGYPLDASQDYAYVTSLTGYELARETFPTRRTEPRPPQSPQKRERCPQHRFDPILRRFAASHETVGLRYRTELVDLEQARDHVRATVQDVDTGELETLTADYLVGTDGASSSVRRHVGIRMHGRPTLSYTTHVLFRSAELRRVATIPPAYRYIFIGPDGTWLTITSIDGDDLWRMQIIGGSEPHDVSADEIAERLRRAAGREFRYDVVDVMPWVRRELVAESYRSGRVFIAGDAAHLMSPTGAFGMNTGLGDAVDLGWKLQGALLGWGGEALLDSYEAERKPVAIRNAAEASTNLARMLASRTEPPPENLLAPGAEAEKARRAYGEWYAETLRPEWFTIGINLGYRYDGSPIVHDDGSPVPPSPSAVYEQTARPGARAPHAWLPDGRSTLDLFGRSYTLLRLGPRAPRGSGLSSYAATLGLPLHVVHLAGEEFARLYGAALVLVRPDGHVAWRSHREPEEADHVIDVIRGARGGRAIEDVSRDARSAS